MSETSPSVSVIVPVLDGEATLRDTLEALVAQDLDEPWEVIVVDNGSTDGSAAIAESFGDRVRVVRRKRGEPAGAARNEGVENALAPVLAFTDADCTPEPSWLRAGLATLRTGWDLVQGSVSPAEVAGAFDRTVWVVRESGLYETANLFVRRELFEQVGGFEDPIVEDVRVPFGEDSWLGWRLRRAGASSCFSADAVVRHAVFPRNASDYVAERRRLALFPALVALTPELRRTLLFGRIFLSARSAAFDAALVSLAVALARRSAGPMAGVVPYAFIATRRALRYRPYTARVLMVDIAADAAGALALIRGTIEARNPVL